jgi:hypothetical protein
MSSGAHPPVSKWTPIARWAKTLALLSSTLAAAGCAHEQAATRTGPAAPGSRAHLMSEGGRDSLACISDDEPAVRERFRDVAAEYYAFRAEQGPVLEAQWDAILREVLFGTRLNGCSRAMSLLDALVDGMKRVRQKR